MPEGSPGTGFDLRRLFSPGAQAREGREDPRTEPHAPAHAAPENPSPITLEDMSDQEGSVSKPEATLTHPSARDTMQPAGVVHIARVMVVAGISGLHIHMLLQTQIKMASVVSLRMFVLDLIFTNSSLLDSISASMTSCCVTTRTSARRILLIVVRSRSQMQRSRGGMVWLWVWCSVQ